MKPRVKGALALSGVAALTPVGSAAAAATGEAPGTTQAPTTTVAVEPLAANTAAVDSAPTLEQEAGRLGAKQVRQIRADLLAAMNRDAVDTFGAMTAERADALGRSTYYGDGDMNVYVVKDAAGTEGYLGVPLHMKVRADGAVQLPEAGTNGLNDPFFNGPWGGDDVYHLTFESVNDGGWSCGTTKAINRTRITARKLNDKSKTTDYYGIAASSVAEITQKSGNCDDYLDLFMIGINSDTAHATYQKQTPLSDYNGNCRDINLSLSASLGGVGAGISETVRQCEYWDVVNGNIGPASNHYEIKYNNNDACDAESREATELAVWSVPQGKARGLWAYYGVNAGNAEKGLCSTNCKNHS